MIKVWETGNDLMQSISSWKVSMVGNEFEFYQNPSNHFQVRKIVLEIKSHQNTMKNFTLYILMFILNILLFYLKNKFFWWYLW